MKNDVQLKKNPRKSANIISVLTYWLVVNFINVVILNVLFLSIFKM